ncbi:SlyX family protein [Pontiellaceae bacterium B12227]|nr:SlyX family protein [Pontiellaceae bacterium B12227]
MEERIIQLETLSALQDQTIQSLNDEIYRQQQDISRLREQLDQLEKKLLEIGEPDQIAGIERPPHY